MRKIVSKNTTYEFTTSELKSFFAKELNVSEKNIEIKFKTLILGGDERLGSERTETYGLEVIVSDETL